MKKLVRKEIDIDKYFIGVHKPTGPVIKDKQIYIDIQDYWNPENEYYEYKNKMYSLMPMGLVELQFNIKDGKRIGYTHQEAFKELGIKVFNIDENQAVIRKEFGIPLDRIKAKSIHQNNSFLENLQNFYNEELDVYQHSGNFYKLDGNNLIEIIGCDKEFLDCDETLTCSLMEPTDKEILFEEVKNYLNNRYYLFEPYIENFGRKLYIYRSPKKRRYKLIIDSKTLEFVITEYLEEVTGKTLSSYIKKNKFKIIRKGKVTKKNYKSLTNIF